MTCLWTKRVVATSALFLLSGVAAFAQESHFVANLRSTESAPEGVGTLQLTVNDSHTAIFYVLTYTSLDSRADISAIQVDPPAETPRTTVVLCGASGRPECPTAGGTVSGVITAKDIRPVQSEGLAAKDFTMFLQLVMSGDTQAVVHDIDNDNGDIRGQIVPSSE